MKKTKSYLFAAKSHRTGQVAYIYKIKENGWLLGSTEGGNVIFISPAAFSNKKSGWYRIDDVKGIEKVVIL